MRTGMTPTPFSSGGSMGLPVIASIASTAAGALGQWAANRSNKHESQRNRRFQERMRNTQWQAAVADMQAAGINPAAAIDQGPNAAPSGSVGAKQENVGAAGVSTMLQVQQVASQVKAQQAEILLKGAQRGLLRWSTAKERYQALTARDDYNLLYGEPGGQLSLRERDLYAQTRLNESTATGRQLQNQIMQPMASVADAFQVPVSALAQWAGRTLQNGLDQSSLRKFMRVLGFEADRAEEFIREVGSAYWNYSPVNQIIRLFNWSKDRLQGGG